MDARIPPIRRANDIPMFDRVVMDVVDVLFIIPVVANQMFPIAALPDAAFFFFDAAWPQRLALGDLSGKGGFDQHPTRRKIRIALGQRPHRMQMLRKNHHCVDVKWMSCLDSTDYLAKQFHVVHQRRCVTVGEIDGEEIGSSSDEGAAVTHWSSDPGGCRCNEYASFH